MSATWFRCDPAKLIGALAAMEPEQGYVYTMVLMRIYEVGGPIGDDERSLARRTGFSIKKVSEAISWLIQKDKIQRLESGLLDSRTTHAEIAYREKLIKDAQNAGNSSVKKRGRVSFQKDNENQQTEPTPVERSPDDRPTTEERASTDLEVDRELESKNNNPPPSRSTIPEKEEGDLKGFEEFWELFPKGPLASIPKSEAAWRPLSLAERAHAIAGIPAVRARKTTTNPLNPDTYLRDKMFAVAAAKAERVSSQPEKVRIERISPQGDAWDRHWRDTHNGKGAPWSSGAWWFETEWPPTEVVPELMGGK